MTVWRLLLFSVLLVQKTYSAQAVVPPRSRYNHLTTDSINRLNARANNIYLADPVYGRKLATEALLASKIINYQKGIGHSSFNIGITYWAQSYYSISLLYVDTALRYLQKSDPNMISVCYRYMGRNYTDLKDYKSADYFLNKALKTAGTNKQTILSALSEQSYLYLKLQQYDKAYDLVEQALKYTAPLHDLGTLAILYSRLVTIYAAKKQFDKALSYNDSTLRMSYLVNNKRLRANAYISNSSILLAQHNIAGALQYANKGLALSDSLGIMDASDRSYNAIIAVYALTGDNVKLAYYQGKYNEFLNNRLTLLRQSNSQLMRDHFELNNELQDIDIFKQNAREDDLRIRAQQQAIVVLVISLLLVATALYIVWFYYRQKTAIAIKLRDQYIATLAQSQIIESQAHDLQELNNFKSKLLAIIGHDLRAPINNLRNVTDMFEDGSFSADEVQLLMKNLNPVVKGAELTLSNLLVWADGQIRGIKNIHPTSVNLLKVIKQTEDICRSDLNKKQIGIHSKVSPDAIALVDENHLKVILSNLVSNAVKFTNGNGEITISADSEDEKIVISINDTGIGMSSEEMEKLLSANTHFSKPGTQGETGTGIGLLLCRELIDLNGGKLWLTSNLGKGTTFYFSLPAVGSKIA